MIWLDILLVVLAVCFGGVLLFGAPYMPTMKPQIKAALELAGLKPGETLLELGCGDGRVLIAAAQAGLNVVGYELNPLLAALAWLRTRRYRKRVRVVCADFWQAKWPPAGGIFTFLLPKYMGKLDKKISLTTSKPVKLVSFAFEIKDKEPAAVEKGVFLYLYK